MKVFFVADDYRGLVRELIDKKFKSRRQFCEASGIDPAHLSRFLKGTKELSLEVFFRAMKTLGVETPNNLILQAIALTYARVGMAEQAVVIAGMLTDKYDRASTLTTIASVELGLTFESDPRLLPFGPLPPR